MEMLFAYGTLQHEPVQRATFGRVMSGSRDRLIGFEAAPIELDRTYTIARHTGRADDIVAGTVFGLTPEELAAADAYEAAPYVRVAVALESGLRAWVYVDEARRPPAQSR